MMGMKEISPNRTRDQMKDSWRVPVSLNVGNLNYKWCRIQPVESRVLTMVLRQLSPCDSWLWHTMNCAALTPEMFAAARPSGQWQSWRSPSTSAWGSGRWSRSPAPPCSRCLALAWLAWKIWATVATSTLSCKCFSVSQTSRASKYCLSSFHVFSSRSDMLSWQYQELHLSVLSLYSHTKPSNNIHLQRGLPTPGLVYVTYLY